MDRVKYCSIVSFLHGHQNQIELEIKVTYILSFTAKFCRFSGKKMTLLYQKVVNIDIISILKNMEWVNNNIAVSSWDDNIIFHNYIHKLFNEFII